MTISAFGGNASISNSESNYNSINAGAGNDTIINEHAYYPTIEGGDGNDKIIIRRGNQTYIDGGAGNDSILGEIPSGGWAMGGSGNDYINPVFSDSASINGGEGNDTIITSGNDATLNGGAGDDSLFVDSTAPITFDMSKGGADKIYSYFDGENITLKGYKASNGGGIAMDELSTQNIVTDIIENGGVTFSDDAIKINDDEGTSGKYTFAGNVINLFDVNDEKQAIGFTNKDSGKLNVSKESDDYLLVGNYFDNKNGGSTIIGGKGNDTLLGGEGDALNSGGGNDNLILFSPRVFIVLNT